MSVSRYDPWYKMALVVAAVFAAGFVAGGVDLIANQPDPFGGFHRDSDQWDSLEKSYPGQMKPWEGPATAWSRVRGGETNGYKNCWVTGDDFHGFADFCEKASRIEGVRAPGA